MNRVNELLEDLEFVRWVKKPDDGLNIFWNSWIGANPDRVEDVKLAREILLGLQFPSRLPSEDVKNDVLSKILRQSEVKIETNPALFSRTKSRDLIPLMKAAAILVGILVLSVLAYQPRNFEQKPQVETPVPWVTKSAAAGEKLSFRLPDQTIVWLNSESSLEFPSTFDSNVRLVRLKGEGFFEVAENANHPFVVESRGLLTKALGTSFNIEARENKNLIVSLISGKVSVKYHSDSLDFYLNPGEELSFHVDRKKAEVGRFDVAEVTGWKFGSLIFVNASLDRVKSDLESWYGVEITILGTPKNRWRFNGRFENQTLDNVLKSMSNVENFTYRLKGKKISIQFN